MTFRIDPRNTTLSFSVKHMMIATVRGTFDSYTAHLEIDPRDLSSSRVSARVETRSVNTGDRLRDEYLTGTHFFNPEKFPHLSFESAATRVSGSKINITGNLTIRDRNRPLTLDGKFRHTAPGTANERLRFDLMGEVDREAYDLMFHGAVETVSVVVGKKVKLELGIELVRA